MVRRITSKPRRGGYHSSSKADTSRNLPDSPLIEDDSFRISPGNRDAVARDVQFRATTSDYLTSHLYGGRVHPPSYDNG